MTSFEMASANRPAKLSAQVFAWVLWAPLALFRRALQAQREYLAIQHLRGLEREQLDDVGLERSQIEAAVRGRIP